jgi:hypothetical protein
VLDRGQGVEQEVRLDLGLHRLHPASDSWRCIDSRSATAVALCISASARFLPPTRALVPNRASTSSQTKLVNQVEACLW